MPTSWRDILDANKLWNSTIFTTDFESVRGVAEAVGYKFFAFNGGIYPVEGADLDRPIGRVEDLKEAN